MTVSGMSHPHPKNLTEQDCIDGADRAVDNSSQRPQQHVGPLWLVVLEDSCYWGSLHTIIVWIILAIL